jgi:hypothetical protein
MRRRLFWSGLTTAGQHVDALNYQEIVASGGSDCRIDFGGRFLFIAGRRGALFFLGGLTMTARFCFSPI